MKPIPFLLALTTAAVLAEEVRTPAFPGVQGAGALTSGGRGGSVYRVTNLNLDGPGSLADAVSKSGRIVVFDVSGIIDLSPRGDAKKPGKIVIAQPDITIAGQTAPGEGICIKGGTLQISASNVIVRHLRVRRGWNHEGDTGDAIEVKPVSLGESTAPAGQTQEAFDKRKEKKEGRGRMIHRFAELSRIVIDHCSTSWATDENLTCTHADRTTVSWSIAAEGCDYANPKQTPPNHSEGSLWGSAARDGSATLHHVLYADNRLRNPRTTGGADAPAALTMFNCVIYNWSEVATHTGSERIHLNWLNNYYKPGPNTPEELKARAFGFFGDAGARVFVGGNAIEGASAASADNRLAVYHDRKFKNVSDVDKMTMVVDQPFGELPARIQSAEDACASVIAEAGATLPARDAVDLRIVRSVRDRTGGIIDKEADLPFEQRWPDYRSLPPPPDGDGDGLPDFWETQFGLAAGDPKDSARLSADRFANIEHYFNNTDPRGTHASIVSVSTTVSRAAPGQPGEWRFTRSGDLHAPLTVRYHVSGDAESGHDYEPLSGSVTFAEGQPFTTLALTPLATTRDDRTVVVTLDTKRGTSHTGCPSSALVVIRHRVP